MTQPGRQHDPGAARHGEAPEDAEFLRRLHDVAHLFNGEWTSAILLVLSDGPKHYTEIRDRIRSLATPDRWSGRHRKLHDSVLTRTLKTLTAHGLIEREQVSSGFPPSVRYTMSPATAELLAAWEPVVAWARTHADLITRAQRRHRDEAG